MSKICLVSLGCSKNLINSERILGQLASDGNELVHSPEDADTIIVNTCCFIDSATEETVQTIKEMAKYKKELVVAGCMVSRFGDKIFEMLPEVNRVIKEIDETSLRLLSTPVGTAYLKIAEGCDNHCTYCVIPKLKGPYESRPHEEILKEANDLIKMGVREVSIVAQDITAYNDGQMDLADLLNEIAKLDFVWIRIHYAYPERITEKMILAMAKNDKILKYIDMPIQHINNEILQKMNRKSTKENIIDLMAKLRAAMPGITLRTTLIVGFPGETDEQFEELYNFVRLTKFNHLGVFEFSPQEGTAAAEMGGQVDNKVKSDRKDKLMKLQAKISSKINKARIGQLEQVIIEGEFEEGYIGRTTADSLDIDGQIYIYTDLELNEGDMVVCSVIGAENYDLIGEILDNS